jgi:hypothetical protein
MAKFHTLHDLYRFPGFVPQPQVRGLFGDPRAVVIPLRRRRKKRPAVFVAEFFARTTTSGPGVFGTWLVATSAFTLLATFAASPVASVPP